MTEAFYLGPIVAKSGMTRFKPRARKKAEFGICRHHHRC